MNAKDLHIYLKNGIHSTPINENKQCSVPDTKDEETNNKNSPISTLSQNKD